MIVLILQLTADRLHVTKSIRSLEPGTNYFSNLKLKLEFEQMGGIVSTSTAKKIKIPKCHFRAKQRSSMFSAGHFPKLTSNVLFHTREPALFSRAEDPNCAGKLPKFPLTSTFH